MLHGVISFHDEAMPIWGLSQSSSVMPTARSIARAGAFCMPVVTSWERGFRSADMGFTEPYLFDRSIAISGDIFRRDLNSFNFFNNQRNTTYQQATTGLQIRTGVPINEFLYFQARYGLSKDDISLDRATFFTDPDGTAVCCPLRAHRSLQVVFCAMPLEPPDVVDWLYLAIR